MRDAPFGQARAVCDFPVAASKAKSVGEKVIVNRASSNKPTARQTRRAIFYIDRQFDMGAQHDVARGQWYGVDGAMTMDQAEAYGTAQALEHKYTFHLILSVRDGDPTDAQFVDAVEQMGAHFDNYQLLVHRDTAHTHAHILWYRQTLTDKQTFFAVKNGLETRMKQHENAAIRDGNLSYAGHKAWQSTLHNTADLDWGMEM